MSIGTRIARHGQAKLRASINPTPHEPLLFLYPSWIRASSTTVTQSFIDRILPNTLPLTSTSSQRDTREISRHPGNTPLNSEQAISDGLVANGRASTEVHTVQTRHGNPQIRSGSKTGELASVEKKLRRLLVLSDKKHEVKELKIEGRRAWQAQRDEILKRDWDPDWRVLLEELKKSTPYHGKWLVEPITLEMSDTSALRLMRGLDENIWTIANAHDCVVRLGRTKNNDKSQQTFVLSGSPVAISRTTARLLRIVPDMKVKQKITNAVPGPGESPFRTRNGTGNLSNVVASSHRGGSRRLPTRPQNWSSESFHNYVHKLTQTPISNHTQRIMYAEGGQHITMVMQVLQDLFSDPKNKPFVTNMATREALAFYMKFNNIAAARLLFNDHASNDSELYNIMLRQPAENNDLFNFHYIFSLMLRRGHQPNRATWLAFLEANKDTLAIQLNILSAMRAKGLIQDISSIRQVASIIVPPSIETELFTSTSGKDFTISLDERFGPDWLNLSTANRILHILGTRGLISRCCEFLQTMEERFVSPDTFSINTVLHHCKEARTLESAIEVLNLPAVTTGFAPNEETYRILFEMAWQSRSYNVARVVWKYACLTSHVAPRMRRLMHSSLPRGTHDLESLSSRNRFIALAGHFIISSSMTSSKALPEPLRVLSSSQSQILSDAGVSSIQKSHVQIVKERRHRLAETLDVEMHLSRYFKPRQALKDALTEAFTLDKKWKAEEAANGKKKGFQSMLEEGKRVAVSWKSNPELPTQPRRVRTDAGCSMYYRLHVDT